MAVIGGKHSNVEIDSDDVFSLLLATERCPALSISINYLDWMPRRTIVVNTDGLTAAADLISGQLVINGQLREAKVERDDIYIAQLDAVMSDSCDSMCTLAEGAAVDALVDAAQKAAGGGIWVEHSPTQLLPCSSGKGRPEY